MSTPPLDLQAIRGRCDQAAAVFIRLGYPLPSIEESLATVPLLCDRVEALEREKDAALNALADCVAKATQYGTQEGGFIAHYIQGTGTIHHAIAFLDSHGITVRPGFDGRKPLSAEQKAALADFERTMTDEVIPAIVEEQRRQASR